jgi:hypothetical protein
MYQFRVIRDFSRDIDQNSDFRDFLNKFAKWFALQSCRAGQELHTYQTIIE